MAEGTVIDSGQMRIFACVAKTLNMSRAAEELRMTPSGVSHGLRALENDLGCKLFERTSRSMELSPAGRKLLERTGQILELMKEARESAAHAAEPKEELIRLGASTSVARLVLPPVLREFRGSFPEAKVRIETCSEAEALRLLKDGEIDLAVMAEPARKTGVEFVPLGEDELRFIVNPLHPWALKRGAQHQELPQTRLILPPSASGLFRRAADYFQAEKIEIKAWIEAADEEAAKRCASLDLGVAILPVWLAAEEIEEGSLAALPIGRRRLRCRWGALRLGARKPTFRESLFLNICRGVLRGLIAR